MRHAWFVRGDIDGFFGLVPSLAAWALTLIEVYSAREEIPDLPYASIAFRIRKPGL
jgi:hypothetical protein